jgi:uncharacterized membrane protein
MTKRMALALLSLVGAFVALYLALFKMGIIGELSCTVGSCNTVQLSRWATFLGLPVATWGVGFYLLTLGLSLAGLQDRWVDSRGLSLTLLALTAWGVLFSAWLTYLELVVIDAICMWCVISAIIVLVMFAIAWMDWRERREELEDVEESALEMQAGD